MTRQEHLLTTAAEECAEVAQRCSKAARFGMTQVQRAKNDKPEQNPGKLDNRQRIVQEYTDLVAVMEMLGIEPGPESQRTLKKKKVEKYLLVSKKLGKLWEW